MQQERALELELELELAMVLVLVLVQATELERADMEVQAVACSRKSATWSRLCQFWFEAAKQTIPTVKRHLQITFQALNIATCVMISCDSCSTKI